MDEKRERCFGETTRGFCLNNEAASGHSKTGCFITASLSCILKIQQGDSCPSAPPSLPPSPRDVVNALTSMSLSQINRMDSGCCLITTRVDYEPHLRAANVLHVCLIRAAVNANWWITIFLLCIFSSSWNSRNVPFWVSSLDGPAPYPSSLCFLVSN